MLQLETFLFNAVPIVGVEINFQSTTTVDVLITYRMYVLRRANFKSAVLKERTY